MRLIKTATLAAAALLAASPAAFAADLLIEAPSAPQQYVDNSFNWNGAYLGIYGTGQNVPAAFGLGADFGVNALQDNILFGAEVSAAWLGNGSWTGQVNGKLGVLAAPEIAIYGLAGFGAHSANGAFVPVGVGLEAAVADNLSLKAEYQYNFDLSTAAQSSHVVKVGLNWHF